MKTSLLLAAAATAVSAHYTFPQMTVNGAAVGSAWESVRKTVDWQDNGPVTDVTSQNIRCNELAPGTASATTLNVTAGATVGFAANPDVYHPGPAQLYLAKVPAGQTAATWDGSGQVWFKIYAEQPTFGSQLTWPSMNAKQINIALPTCLPSGEYLYRVEHIGLHVAQSKGGAQFYLSCGQINIAGGGGDASPGPKVALPGAYSATDPGILININYPVPTSYTNPGPAVFAC
ncbi:glycoside hydrolase, family 61 [Diplogelasinospora grovesii]|uniref:lytic cellulose monooxygenase (C4-dehydrogenating) n=1 Tax=Diplogelasinospora grovesii TaxID=303347 RepID=A0AAN6N4N2_9PEZI|nr:glycoside hydrolase, family 61 [Diplogelasinospora grovesii]